MKIVYIAHSISGDVKGNIQKILNIVGHINIAEPDILPFAHYIVDCQALNDDMPEERERGIRNDIALLKTGVIDEMWLYGDKISHGMMHEIFLANELNIPIISKSEGTKHFKSINYAYNKSR